MGYFKGAWKREPQIVNLLLKDPYWCENQEAVENRWYYGFAVL